MQPETVLASQQIPWKLVLGQARSKHRFEEEHVSKQHAQHDALLASASCHGGVCPELQSSSVYLRASCDRQKQGRVGQGRAGQGRAAQGRAGQGS